MSCRGNIESHLYLQAIIYFHQLTVLKDTSKTHFFRYHKTKKDDPIMAPTNLFGNIINIHPFEDENGRICRLILAHVLIRMKCSLSPVILSSFHGRGRRHYIRTVKIFDRNLSILYTMIVKSLVHCLENFEPNARMLAQC